MSEATGEVPIISYARSDLQSLVPVRPVVMLIPNLAAIATIFIPLENGDTSPVEFILSIYKHSSGPWYLLYFPLLFPFFLFIPIAAWNTRLVLSSSIQPFERVVAWSLSCMCLAMPLSCLGAGLFFHRVLRIRQAGFPLIILSAAIGVAIWGLKRWATNYVTALAALTGAVVLNVSCLLTIFVMLDWDARHKFWPRCAGPNIDALILLAQVIALFYLLRQCIVAQRVAKVPLATVAAVSEA